MPGGFDPDTRHETWCFLRVPDHRPGLNRDDRLIRLPFNIVHYEDSPDGFIEPRPPSELYDFTGDNFDLIAAPGRSQGLGRVVRFEIFDTIPFEGVHGFGSGGE